MSARKSIFSFPSLHPKFCNCSSCCRTRLLRIESDLSVKTPDQDALQSRRMASQGISEAITATILAKYGPRAPMPYPGVRNGHPVPFDQNHQLVTAL